MLGAARAHPPSWLGQLVGQPQCRDACKHERIKSERERGGDGELNRRSIHAQSPTPDGFFGQQSLARSSKKLWTWRGSSPKLAARAKIDAGVAWGEHGHQVQERPRQYGAAQRAPPGGLNRGRSGPLA